MRERMLLAGAPIPVLAAGELAALEQPADDRRRHPVAQHEVHGDSRAVRRHQQLASLDQVAGALVGARAAE